MFQKKTPQDDQITEEKRRFTDRLDDLSTNLGKGIVIKGDLHGKEGIELRGQIEGNLHLEATLVVHKGGKVVGDVKAADVVIEGSVEGDVYATQHIELRNAAEVRGNLEAASIAISEGAFFQGAVKMGRGKPDQSEPFRFSEKRRPTA